MNEVVQASVAGAAAALDHAVEQVRAGEVAQALAIAALCDLHRVDETVLVEGAERWVPGGADGTPLIGEFITGEISAICGISVGAAFTRIGQVLNLRHRHPTLWEAFLAGGLRWWEAARVADAAASAGLDAAACARFDRLCATALALQPWARIRTQIERWLILADPEQAARRAHAQAAHRYVHVGGIESGHVGLWGRLDAGDGIVFDEAISWIADGLEGPTADHRRAAAVGTLARSVLGQEPLPVAGRPRRTADVIIHIDADQPHTAAVERWGHVLTPHLATIMSGCAVRIRPVVHAAGIPASDAYQPPESMALAVRAQTPVDVFPHGSRPARACQLDHTIPYDHTSPAGMGQTRVENLGPLSPFTHRLKTHGGWHLTQPTPGVYHWESPLGYRYTVTPAGTLRTDRPPPLRSAGDQSDAPRMLRTRPPDPGQ